MLNLNITTYINRNSTTTNTYTLHFQPTNTTRTFKMEDLMHEIPTDKKAISVKISHFGEGREF